jgi:hypothetical protein
LPIPLNWGIKRLKQNYFLSNAVTISLMVWSLQ